MALEVGSRIAHYDVTALIGEGGMGQVYQATDTKLNRQVALKILPDAFASDPDRLARFQREAQVLASLNHPNIGQIHGIEETDGTRALVLELIEGPTLADRIAQGPIPVDEALPIAEQIAEAFEAAHEAGVIHRDLKPANIKVREDGTVKVLDFGLAKALGGDAESDPCESPTLTAAATRQGVIMGTAAYMSPEQARGRGVDKRTDIWAFGAVLFEMLTARRAFDGESPADVLATVLEREPDWPALPSATPGPVYTLLRRCLAKERKKRLPDIGVARLDVDDALGPADATRVWSAAAPQLQVWQRPIPLMFGVVILLVAAVLAVRNATRIEVAEPGTVLRSEVRLEGVNADTVLTSFESSPDGSVLTYSTRNMARTAGGLYLRSLDQLESRLLVPEPAYSLFFSPDGQSVGFFTLAGLRTVPVSSSLRVTDNAPP